MVVQKKLIKTEYYFDHEYILNNVFINRMLQVYGTIIFYINGFVSF